MVAIIQVADPDLVKPIRRMLQFFTALHIPTGTTSLGPKHPLPG